MRQAKAKKGMARAKAAAAEMEELKKHKGTKTRRTELHPLVIGNMRQILDFLIEYIAYFSYPPSVREIALACNLSVGSVYWYLVRLERAGYVRRESGVARGLTIEQGLVKFDQQFGGSYVNRGKDGRTVVDDSAKHSSDGMAGDHNHRIRVSVEGRNVSRTCNNSSKKIKENLLERVG